MKSKKGFSIMEVPTLAISLGVIAIVLGIVATILVQIQATQTTSGYAYNITQEGIEGITDFSEWQTTWVVVIAAAVIIGIIGAYLFFRPANE